MNKVMFVGRVATDPILRFTQNGQQVVNFRIAVNKTNNREEADFFPVVAWGKLAEVVEKYCQKGRQIAICGRLQNKQWEKGGQKYYSTEIIAESIDLLARPSTSTKPVNPTEPEGEDWLNINQEEDLPF